MDKRRQGDLENKLEARRPLKKVSGTLNADKNKADSAPPRVPDLFFNTLLGENLLNGGSGTNVAWIHVCDGY